MEAKSERSLPYPVDSLLSWQSCSEAFSLCTRLRKRSYIGQSVKEPIYSGSFSYSVSSKEYFWEHTLTWLFRSLILQMVMLPELWSSIDSWEIHVGGTGRGIMETIFHPNSCYITYSLVILRDQSEYCFASRICTSISTNIGVIFYTLLASKKKCSCTNKQ